VAAAGDVWSAVCVCVVCDVVVCAAVVCDAVACVAVVCVDAVVEDRAGAGSELDRRAPRRDLPRAAAVAGAGRPLSGCRVVRLKSV
jgi:hypothetical protein